MEKPLSGSAESDLVEDLAMCGETGPLGYRCSLEKGHDGVHGGYKLKVKDAVTIVCECGTTDPGRHFPTCRFSPEVLGIVGNCQQCGAPIFGPKTIADSSSPINIRYSCDCNWRRKVGMQTK